MVPLPYSVKCSAQVQPRNAKTVYAGEEGILDEILVEPGEQVVVGTPIAKLRNIQLELEFAEARSALKGLRKQLEAIEQSGDQRDLAARKQTEIEIGYYKNERIPQLEERAEEANSQITRRGSHHPAASSKGSTNHGRPIAHVVRVSSG